MEYPINKGVGKRVEFKGLTAGYLFLFAGGLAAVLLGRTWHFIDSEGRVRISCPGCRWVKPFRNGRAQAERDGKRFEIDRSGREFDF